MALSGRYDVVVVGGGTAGAVVAARLSADPARRVALVEAGPDHRAEDTPAAVRGGNFLRVLGLGRLRWSGVTARLTGAQQPKPYLCGRGIGGSSVINGQSAVRGLPGDFDRWGTGWSWAEVLPAFRDLEDDLDFGAAPYHGTGGPVPVSRTTPDAWGPASRAFAEATTGLGHPYGEDINAPGGTGVAPLAWNRRGDARVSTKDAYVEPARGRPNLDIVPDALALRARFAGTRLVGVELSTVDGPVTLAADHAVVCAGALHSPAFLLRSGIGPADELRALGIPVVADLPDVGRNLQDHPTVWLTFPLAPSARLPGTDRLPGHCALRFSSHLPGAPDDDLQLYASDRGLMVALLDPDSTGRVRLRAADPAGPPDVAFDMLAEPSDVDRLAVGLREAVKVLAHPAFAAVLDGPARLSTGRSVEEVPDAELPDVLRQTCTSYNHATGTCRIGAVVDERGRVPGVDGLSVADASVMPRIVRAPTHLTTVMVAERMASQRAAQQL